MGTIMKIRFKDIAQNRNEILFQQGGYCAICLIEPKVPCLDHNHSAPTRSYKSQSGRPA